MLCFLLSLLSKSHGRLYSDLFTVAGYFSPALGPGVFNANKELIIDDMVFTVEKLDPWATSNRDTMFGKRPFIEIFPDSVTTDAVVVFTRQK